MADIYVHPLSNPEDNAMLGALYSRSVDSVTNHIEKLEKVGSGKFMSQYYLGYGHGSIGDMGVTTIYIEGISMIAAKAIEDNRLFAGQEASSRYVDFSVQPFYFPEGFSDLEQAYRDFYTEALYALRQELPSRFPNDTDAPEAQYLRAIDARAFDIIRGFLPAGSTTNVAWVTSLRNAKEHLETLLFHPFEEVAKLAEDIYCELHRLYPNSFHEHPGTKTLVESDERIEARSNFHNFYGSKFEPMRDDPFKLIDTVECFDAWTHYPALHTQVDQDSIDSFKRIRPKHLVENAMTNIEVSAVIDFGSFRDLQRHRGGYCSNELPSINGFSDWYMDNLPNSMKEKAFSLFAKVIAAYDKLGLEDEAMISYMLPMGCTVHVSMYMSVNQAIYIAELRSSKTVHHTLRCFAQRLGAYINELSLYGIEAFCDWSVSDWDVKRGNQTILPKL